jgi:hypothetical protein
MAVISHVPAARAVTCPELSSTAQVFGVVVEYVTGSPSRLTATTVTTSYAWVICGVENTNSSVIVKGISTDTRGAGA